jgi:hypothetical protein
MRTSQLEKLTIFQAMCIFLAEKNCHHVRNLHITRGWNGNTISTTTE